MIHLARDGTQLGVFSLSQVNEMLAAGQLKLTDLAWQEGLPSWIPLKGIMGIALAVPELTPSATLSVENTSPASLYAAPHGVVSGSFHQAGQVPPGSIQALKETRPWVLFIAILGLLGTVLIILAALTMLFLGGAAPTSGVMPPGMSTGLMIGLAVGYLFIALLYLYPIIKLFKYSSAIQRLTSSGQASDLDEALRQQKSFWKFIGMVLIILMAIYFLIIVAVVAVGLKNPSLLKLTPPESRPTTTLLPTPS